MANKTFIYELPPLGKGEFPDIPRPDGAKLTFQVHSGSEVEILGNTEGLLHLARNIAAMAMLKKCSGLHIHLDPECGDIDEGSSMVTIHNLDFGGRKGTF